MNHQLPFTLDRRGLLRGGVALLGCTGLARAARPEASGRNVVLVQLSGGNDSLSMLVPFADDEYHAVRRTTAHRTEDVLRIDDAVGLNSRLEGLRGIYDAGHLALVQGVGYAEPNRSHFKSMDIWHTARGRGRDSGPGWVGRLCAAAFADEVRPETVVHVGRDLPYSLHSTEYPPTAFVAPQNYRWVGGEQETESYRKAGELEDDEMGGGGTRKDDVLAELRKVLRDANESSYAVRRAAARYRAAVDYPESEFGRSLRSVAALIDAHLGTRVYSVSLGGFDTHANQKNRHDNLMGTLDAALTAFYSDLDGRSTDRETLVVVFSEFGRRVAENGSRGHDHGTAGTMLVMGHSVRGGLYGEQPSLTELDKGDLIHTTDFRRVYADVVDTWFGADGRRVLGGNYTPLGLC